MRTLVAPTAVHRGAAPKAALTRALRAGQFAAAEEDGALTPFLVVVCRSARRVLASALLRCWRGRASGPPKVAKRGRAVRARGRRLDMSKAQFGSCRAGAMVWVGVVGWLAIDTASHPVAAAADCGLGQPESSTRLRMPFSSAL